MQVKKDWNYPHYDTDYLLLKNTNWEKVYVIPQPQTDL